MSKKLGLESKYKQFINPTKLGEYKATMAKGTSFKPTKDTFKQRRYTLAGGPAKFLAKAAFSAAKRTPIGRLVTAVGKIVTSKPGMFGAGIGVGAASQSPKAKSDFVTKDKKKMGGGMMMKYKTGKAVTLSPKQKKIAAMAGNPNKIDAPDFAKLRSMKAKSGRAVTLKQVYAHAQKNKGEDRVTSRDIKMSKKALGYKDALPEIKATGARMGKMMKKKNV
jgi:hypothetical protein|tara:strand:- start:45 stop:707 length:663 start_codon:yes stop_codon:yes gene_type:complete